MGGGMMRRGMMGGSMAMIIERLQSHAKEAP